jgi:hypothetical protein
MGIDTIPQFKQTYEDGGQEKRSFDVFLFPF